MRNGVSWSSARALLYVQTKYFFLVCVCGLFLRGWLATQSTPSGSAPGNLMSFGCFIVSVADEC